MVIYVIHKYHYTQIADDVNRFGAKISKIYINHWRKMHKVK